MGVLFAPIAAVYPSIYVDKFFTWDSVLRFYQIFGIWLILLNLFAVTAKGHVAHSILKMRDLCRHVAMNAFEVVSKSIHFLYEEWAPCGQTQPSVETGQPNLSNGSNGLGRWCFVGCTIQHPWRGVARPATPHQGC